MLCPDYRYLNSICVELLVVYRKFSTHNLSDLSLNVKYLIKCDISYVSNKMK